MYIPSFNPDLHLLNLYWLKDQINETVLWFCYSQMDTILDWKNRMSTVLFRRLSLDGPKNAIHNALKRFQPAVPFRLFSKDSSPMNFLLEKSSSLDSLGPDSQLLYYIYRHFLPPHAKELERSCDALIEKLYKKKSASMTKLSAIVQDFFAFISEQADKFGPKTEEFSSTEFLEHVESFVCARAYGILFCSRSEEEIMDVSLQERIRSLYWVTHGFLETSLDFASETVDELLHDAMTEIADMNSHKEIKRKFECLMQCSTKIIQAIHESTKSPADGDQFLSVLIYVVLKSNPTMMQSNLSFIQRFSMPLRNGEADYYLTHLHAAVKFIQNLDAAMLRMCKDAFNMFVALSTPTRK